jgi:glycosyltransferase involved in cell wall biosynthesis
MAKIDYLAKIALILDEKKTSISCIIPAYNEEGRVTNVLKVVEQFPYFSEIVVVNDGSTDATAQEIKDFVKTTSKISFYDNKENKGKTKVVLEGISKSHGELIVLIDADLRNLTHQDIAKMIYFVINGEYQMTIIDRGSDRAVWGPLASLTCRFNGGERVFWRNEYEKVPFNVNDGYLFEQIINLHYVKNGLKVRTIYCPKLKSAWQFKKKGLIKGLKVYTNMFIKVYRNSHIKGFYLQVGAIEEDRLEPLYKLYNRSDNFMKIPIILIVVFGTLASIITFITLNLSKFKGLPFIFRKKE